MNDGDISMTTMIECKQAKENHKKFLYARATHSSHMIQYHMQLIMGCQKVVDKYRSMVEEGRDFIPLESHLYKSDPAVISQIISMIDVDILWHQKTFGAVLLHCKENKETHKEMDKKEVIDLCSESPTTTSDHWKAEQNKNQENHDTEESKQLLERQMKKGVKRTIKPKIQRKMK